MSAFVRLIVMTDGRRPIRQIPANQQQFQAATCELKHVTPKAVIYQGRADSKLLNLARTVHDPYVGSFGTNPKPLLAKTSLVPKTNHCYLKPENAAHTVRRL